MMMSFRKLALSVVSLAVLGFLGAQGTAGAALSPALNPDGKITAKEVRTLILKASDATKHRGMTPKVAKIDGRSLRITSSKCANENDWLTYNEYSSRHLVGGKLCDGDIRFGRKAKLRPHYFQKSMGDIVDHVLVDTDIEEWSLGGILRISSNGKVATLVFGEHSGGKPAHPIEVLRIVGSKVKVKSRY